MDVQNNSKQTFKFNARDDSETTDDQLPLTESTPVVEDSQPLFNWSAPESLSASKPISWYLALTGITLATAAGIFFITKDKITTGVILFSGLLLGVYGTKKPKTVSYQLTKQGFTVNGRFYRFGNYRSFAIVDYGEIRSVVLTPLKRFVPYTYIYFHRENEPQVTSTLAAVLPREMTKNDVIDKVLHKIGF